jgi:hypothetical protein
MIIRPYRGPLFIRYYSPLDPRTYDFFLESRGYDYPIPAVYRELDDQAFLERCHTALNLIVRGAKREDEEGVSSHSILKSIDSAWPKLADLFGWA